jgi:natural product biosynthesis luciferase-like monooxygenase protein
MHELIEEQVDRTPDAIALVSAGEEITYRQLDARANRLARHLERLGVGPDVLVGISIERSVDMVVAALGVLKAGGAYVPIDPAYPKKRLGFILDDAQVRVLVTQESLARDLPHHRAQLVSVDADREAIEAESADRVKSAVTPNNLAYVIYTSGSTGKPKGVMVEHRNVVNFFTGMDAVVTHEPPGVWLAVSSLSFDISVLELFWTLTQGFKTVIYADELQRARAARTGHVPKAIEFSLLYFASDDENHGSSHKYRLLLEGAKFADEHGFAAVWTPERHFHPFGGLYPNPSVTSAAIAAVTTRVMIRAGSCVLPLQNPIRVAEEWSLVDNLSNGRVGVSFASGWQPNDFVLMPEHYENAKDILVRDIDVVRRLWRGETLALPGPRGTVDVRTFPRPVQPELPFWITSAGSPETFRLAGEMGANVLTHLLGQSVTEVGEKLKVYRQAWRQAGHSGDGHVTLMLHAFVADEDAFVHAQVHQPLKNYLRSAASLIKPFASTFPPFQKTRGKAAATADLDFSTLSEEDLEALAEYAFARYYETSGLFGTPTGCLSMVDELKRIGVNEIACLIDFGVPTETVLAHLPHLNRLRELATSPQSTPPREQGSIAALIRRHGVTHLQCTPSLAGTLTIDEETREALRSLHQLLVGGEMLTTPLAVDLRSLVSGDVINMYGPTETTIWSSTHVVGRSEGRVPIGTPIAHTEFYVLDHALQSTAVGVPGELYIGGHGVARGYLHRPELTAERFVRHPFRAGDTGRLYRTGDLVRCREDGAIEFLGRTDQQVKLRGHRIELAEIENVLAQHPGVREAAVVARETDAGGGTQLVGYYVPAGRTAPTTDDLRRHVMDELPEIMVPSAFVALAELPRTPNGKLDRGALPATEPVKATSNHGFVAPGTPVERALAGIWSAALGVERVGLHDNFLELGGHSLAAIEIAATVRRTFQVELPLEAVFEAPTVAELAVTVERDLRTRSEPTTPGKYLLIGSA